MNKNEMLAEGLNQLLAKREYLQKAQSYYSGSNPELFASPQVKRALNKAGRWSVNFTAIPVKAVATRLQITDIKSDTKRATKLLNDVARRNKLYLELDDCITDTLIYGHSYLTVSVSKGKTDIFSNSPLNTHVVYDQANPRIPAYAVRLWTETNGTHERYRANLYTDTGIYRYVSDMMPHTVDESTFRQIGHEPNPYGVVPVFETRTGRDRTPEHEAGWSVQDQITKFIAGQMSATEYYSYPLRLLMSKEAQATSFGESDQPAISAEPGALTVLQGFDQAVQMDSPKPEHYIQPIDNAIRNLAMVTTTPLTYFREYMRSNVSGEATRATETGFYRKCMDRQAYIDATLKDVFGFVLGIAGLSDEVIIDWKPIETIDQNDIWSVNYKKVQSGMPVEQMLLESGYSQEQVTTWKNGNLLPVLNPDTNRVETQANEKLANNTKQGIDNGNQ